MELTVLGDREPPFLLAKRPPPSLTTSESLVHMSIKNTWALTQAQLLRFSPFTHVTTQQLPTHEGEEEHFLACGAC